MSATVPDAPVRFRPQPAQEVFLATRADIAIIGGGLFGGKTWALAYEPLRHVRTPGFSFVCFRRLVPSLRNVGGIWDESLTLYPHVGAEAREHVLEWDFPSGARGKFAGLQYDGDVLAWKSSQICLLMFDQLEEFSERQFWYMLSRNRSTCGVRPYVRASCNPDPDSWLAEFLAWWIDQETGYAIPARSGALRWFIRDQDLLLWADSQEELTTRYGEERARFAKSLTFVLARLQDNIIGRARDPGYESNVRAMGYVEQERLLGGERGGNWKVRAQAGLVFDRARFGDPVDAVPILARRLRAWDKAATPGAGDWTAGIKLAIAPDGTIYVEDVVRGRWGSGDRESVIKQTAQLDGSEVKVFLEQEPGSGGKDSAGSSIRNLAGFSVEAAPSTGDKVARAGPFAAQVKAGNVRALRAAWTEEFLKELHAFPTPNMHDDQVDAASLAYNRLTLHNVSFTRVRVPMR